jgi:hypothetical protein
VARRWWSEKRLGLLGKRVERWGYIVCPGCEGEEGGVFIFCFAGSLMSMILNFCLVQKTWCWLMAASENLEFVSYGK